MRKQNDFWIDENGNKWLYSHYSEKEAENLSKSLSNCSNCSNCRDCSNCSNCSYCSNCRDCSNCSNCSYCSYCSNCRDCSNCSYCSYCRDCRDCSYCSYCSGFKDNPQRFTSKRIGSRRDNTTIYWLKEKNLVICGCFSGSLDDFETRVKKTYDSSNIYYKEYHDFIKTSKYLIK